MQRATIGITLDHSDEKSYSQYHDWYALRTNYADVISHSGGIPLLLPYDLNAIDQYVSLCDGFVLPGGDFDIAPSHYGKSPEAGLRNPKTRRLNFEMQLFKTIIKSQKPFVAICAGMQLLNVIQGGTLHQDLGEQNQLHEQKAPHLKAAHPIQIESNTKLHQIIQMQEASVNSTHHQAIDRLGDELLVSATASDGVIEAIELQNHPFGLGLEWHPEFCINTFEYKLWSQFVSICTT